MRGGYCEMRGLGFLGFAISSKVQSLLGPCMQAAAQGAYHEGPIN